MQASDPFAGKAVAFCTTKSARTDAYVTVVSRYNAVVRISSLAAAILCSAVVVVSGQESKGTLPGGKVLIEEAGLMDDESIVDITAYVLRVNGAKAGSQRPTRITDASVNSVTSN